MLRAPVPVAQLSTLIDCRRTPTVSGALLQLP
ncbi:hypothetical protein FHW75_004664 [Pseudomonas sp. OG7]|nr:hypothetical protein [Pseudomonas sp. OG7]